MARTTKGRIFKRGKSKAYSAEYYINSKRFRHVLRDQNGKPITKIEQARQALHDLLNPITLKDKSEQVRQLADSVKNLEEKVAEATELAHPPLKITEAWSAFVNSASRPDSGERTISDYNGYCRAFVNWITREDEELLYMRDVTSETAGKYARHLTSSRKSSNTFNKHIGFLKMLYRVLEDQARTKENPFAKITRKKLKTESRRELTIEELYRVLNKAEGDLALLLGLGTFTGLRLGDCCTLRWGEIDLIKRVIRRIPNKTASKNSKPVLIGIPAPLYELFIKISAKKRKGYLLPKLAAVYSETTRRSAITNRIKAHFEACGIQTQKPGTGKYKDSATGEIKDTGKRAVVEVGFHSLRHTYVSLHAERGTPLAVIQGNVGHGNPAMTKHYTHIGEEAARNTATALEMPLIGKSGQSEPERKRLKELVDILPLDIIKNLLNIAEETK